MGKLKVFFDYFCSMNNLYLKREQRFSPIPAINDILSLLSISGCRISELLDIYQCDFIRPDTVIIHGKKGSASRTITSPILEKYFVLNCPNPDEQVFRVSYATVYRECLRSGYFVRHKGSKNKSVTHSFRYKYISSLNDVARNTKVVADCVGHRSRKTSETYLAKGAKNG